MSGRFVRGNRVCHPIWQGQYHHKGLGIWEHGFKIPGRLSLQSSNKSKIVFQCAGFHQCGFYLWLRRLCVCDRCECFTVGAMRASEPHI